MIYWLNDALRDEHTASIAVNDRGFMYGDGLFETMAAREGNLVHFGAHVARLRQGCEVLGMPFPVADIETTAHAVLSANKLTDAAVRLTWTRGPGTRGLPVPDHPQPTLLIIASPLPSPQPPVRCIVATVTRRNEHSPLSRIKSLNYLDNILARQEAARRGADEALLLNTAGYIASASAANIFVVTGDRIATPPVEDGVLAGITRHLVLKNGDGEERSLTPHDLRNADAIYLTSSLGIREVQSVDGSEIRGRNPVLDFGSLAGF